MPVCLSPQSQTYHQIGDELVEDGAASEDEDSNTDGAAITERIAVFVGSNHVKGIVARLKEAAAVSDERVMEIMAAPEDLDPESGVTLRHLERLPFCVYDSLKNDASIASTDSSKEDNTALFREWTKGYDGDDSVEYIKYEEEEEEEEGKDGSSSDSVSENSNSGSGSEALPFVTKDWFPWK
jgi:hypothetical protein